MITDEMVEAAALSEWRYAGCDMPLWNKWSEASKNGARQRIRGMLESADATVWQPVKTAPTNCPLDILFEHTETGERSVRAVERYDPCQAGNAALIRQLVALKWRHRPAPPKGLETLIEINEAALEAARESFLDGDSLDRVITAYLDALPKPEAGHWHERMRNAKQ